MLIGAMLVRNEADRWLRQVLEQMGQVCDKIIVLDDCSTDITPEICREYGAEVYYSDRSYWGMDELKQRKLLWHLATQEAKDGDWILCLDADETIANIERLPVAIKIADQNGGNGIAFALYDMWSPTHYREDEMWNAHLRDWVMCVKVNKQQDYMWRKTPLHCGRFPLNACNAVVNAGLKIQHWGWSRPEDRQMKYQRYVGADPEGKSGSLAQYESILYPNPNLKEFIL